MVEDLRDLRKERWCSHGVLMGELEVGFLAKGDVWRYFGDDFKRGKEEVRIVY